VETFGYIAYDSKGIPRYVGIGNSTRYQHVNSDSHNRILNSKVRKGEIFTIEHFNFSSKQDAAKWEISKIKEFGRIFESGSLFNFSQGGELTTRDLKWCYNPKTSEACQFSDMPPIGYVIGRPKSSSLAKYRWCFDPISKEQKRISPKETLPENWIFGLPEEKKIRGYFWCYSSSKEARMVSSLEEIPKGWSRGVPESWNRKKWIWCHNPETLEGTTIPNANYLPEGYVIGRPRAHFVHGYVWCHNPETKEAKFVKNIPEGFLPGRNISFAVPHTEEAKQKMRERRAKK
jgi:hypothetical protein